MTAGSPPKLIVFLKYLSSEVLGWRTMRRLVRGQGLDSYQYARGMAMGVEGRRKSSSRDWRRAMSESRAMMREYCVRLKAMNLVTDLSQVRIGSSMRKGVVV